MPLPTAAPKGQIAINPVSPVDANAQDIDLDWIVLKCQSLVPPVWPLKDYVAVNPFVGLTHRTFLAAGARLRGFRDVRMLPSLDQLQEMHERGAFDEEDLIASVELCRDMYSDWCGHLSVDQLAGALLDRQMNESETYRGPRTAAALLAELTGEDWGRSVTNLLSTFCGSHFDEGQAAWPSPWKHLPLFEAWRESSQVDQRLDRMGVAAFGEFVAQLPEQPLDALRTLLIQSGVPAEYWQTVIEVEMASIAGWASYLRYRTRNLSEARQISNDLTGLAVIRLAYDVALLLADVHPELRDSFRTQFVSPANGLKQKPTQGEVIRHALLVAAELGYQRQLFDTLRPAAAPRAAGRKSAQLAFCIDVRSETLRRHLEAVGDNVETYGVAGFFGVAFELVDLSGDQRTAQCPALLSPTLVVQETMGDCTPQEASQVLERRRLVRGWRAAWKSFQTSASSCFAAVDSFGLGHAIKLLTDSLQITRPASQTRHDGIPRSQRAHVGFDLSSDGEGVLSLDQQEELARRLLTNLGLTSDFARLVVLCGHGCETTNNPYRAGLNCGACGGHSGETNARLACAILNRQPVRERLAACGLVIPHDVWFVAAIHNTTTDDVSLLDRHAIPVTHATDVSALVAALAEAGRLTRLERAPRLGANSEDDIFRRARDWSEVRPEWGLSGNAAFVIGRHDLTRGRSLGGRSFLHTYDATKDPDHKILEMIMTAPMVVGNWINLQYYASAVDNVAYGSGNKVLHGVVGLLGILEGNGGDLRTGLPWQSIHDGARMQHDPLRMTVVIEASRAAIDGILDKHANLRDLVENGWMYLAACETGQFYRRRIDGTWAVAA